MAQTKNPRITVMLKPETYQVVRQASEAVGASMSSVISELMDESAPTLANLVKVLQGNKPAKVFDQLSEMLVEKQFEASQLQMYLIKQKRLRRRKPKS